MYYRKTLLLTMLRFWAVVSLALFSCLRTDGEAASENGGQRKDDRLLARLEGSGGDFVQFSRDGTTILTSDDASAKVWNSKTYEARGPVLPPGNDNGEAIRCAELSADGKTVFLAKGREVSIWESESGKLLFTLKHDDTVLWAALSEDGKRVVTACRDKSARVWDVSNGKCLLNLPHQRAVTFACFGPDGARLLTVDGSNIHLRDGLTGRELDGETIEEGAIEHDGYPPAAFSRKGGRLAIGFVQWFGVYDARAFKYLAGNNGARASTELGFVRAVGISEDGRTVFAITNSEVGIWDAETGKPLIEELFPLPMYKKVNVGAVFSPDGSKLLVSGEPDLQGIWNIERPKPGQDEDSRKSKRRLQDFGAERVDVARFSPDGLRVAAGHKREGAGYTLVWKAQADADK